MNSAKKKITLRNLILRKLLHSPMAALVAEPAAAVRTYFEEKRLKNKIQDMVLADIVDHDEK